MLENYKQLTHLTKNIILDFSRAHQRADNF